MTYRSPATRWMAACFASFSLLMVGIEIGALAGAYKKSGTVEGSVLGIVAVLLGLAVMAWSIFGVGFMAFDVEGGVVVQNWIRRVKLPWGDIASFQYMDHQQAELSLREQMNTSALVPYVVTKSGEHIAHGGFKLDASRSTAKSGESTGQA